MGESNKENKVEKPENIRTMKSDISQFLKETKPSLIQLLTTQVEAERPAFEENGRKGIAGKLGIAAAAVGAFLILAAGGFYAYQKLFAPAPGPARPDTAPPLFSVEKSAIAYTGISFNSLSQQLAGEAAVKEKEGTMKRIVVLAKTGETANEAEPETIFKEMNIILPGTSLENAEQTMPVLYQTSEGARFAIVVKSPNPGRAFDLVYRAEPDLVSRWAPIFLDQELPIASYPFEDKVYRNISYRRMTFPDQNGYDLAYGTFSGKYFIIANSETAFRAVIDRLWEQT